MTADERRERIRELSERWASESAGWTREKSRTAIREWQEREHTGQGPIMASQEALDRVCARAAGRD
jgi:hypothetical protein